MPYRFIAERRVCERLLQANAVCPGSGRQLGDLRASEQRALRRLIESGVIRDEGEGRYYLYAPAYVAMRRHRRQRILLALLFAILALALTTMASRL
jgi:predicted transcriptional regulator